MSVRGHRAPLCVGKLPGHPHSRAATKPTHSRWPAAHFRTHDADQTHTAAAPPPASELPFRSRDAVKAWLDSSPTSVLEHDLDDASVASSTDSFNSSPARSRPLNCTPKPDNRAGGLPAAVKRAISPPRCPANRTLADVSRVDPAHRDARSLLTLAIPNHQNYMTSPRSGRDERPRLVSPPGGRRPMKVYENDLLEATEEGYSTPGSDFSITAEWQAMLAAGAAAGMNNRGGPPAAGNRPGAQYETGDVSELDLAYLNPVGAPHGVLKPPGTLEPAPEGRTHDAGRYAPPAAVVTAADDPPSAEVKDIAVDEGGAAEPRGPAGPGLGFVAALDRRRTHPQPERFHDENASRRANSDRSSSMRTALEQVQKQKVDSTAAAWQQAKCSKLSNRYIREETKIKSWEDHQRAKASIAMKQAELKLEAKRAHIVEKMQNEIAVAHRKAEEKKAVAEAKRAEKAARAAAEAERIRRTGKVPRGCLFLV